MGVGARSRPPCHLQLLSCSLLLQNNSWCKQLLENDSCILISRLQPQREWCQSRAIMRRVLCAESPFSNLIINQA